MARDQKRQQKSLARKTARRKTRRKALARNTSAFAGPSMSGAGKWPLLECLISANWRDTPSLCQILIARQAPTGDVSAGVFLVDLGCLGLKNGFLSRFSSAYEYRSTLQAKLMEREELISCNIALAAKVLEEAVRFARKLGFEPDKDGRRALKTLGDADPEDCPETVPLGGEDGRPLFFAGPNDNVPRIMATLERNVGRDGFSFVAFDGPPPADLPGDSV